MKIRELSDLHLEFRPMTINPAGEDVLILGGDIALHTGHMEVVKKMARQFDVPILVIAGNHEFYTSDNALHHTWEGTIDDLRNAADHDDKIVRGEVTFFEDLAVEYEGVRFVGCTLWTDMRLYGDDPLVCLRVQDSLNDYCQIRREHGEDMRYWDTIDRHNVSRKFLVDTLSQKHDGPTVVFTHHAPSWLSVMGHHKSDVVSAGYASRLEDLMLDYEPVLWFHGHTHCTLDYEVGKTRVICNARGYRDGEVPEFNPELIVEI